MKKPGEACGAALGAIAKHAVRSVDRWTVVRGREPSATSCGKGAPAPMSLLADGCTPGPETWQPSSTGAGTAPELVAAARGAFGTVAKRVSSPVTRRYTAVRNTGQVYRCKVILNTPKCAGNAHAACHSSIISNGAMLSMPYLSEY